jgi:LysM repeat protein
MGLRRAGLDRLMLSSSAVAAIFACAAMSGCASITGQIYESARGSVYLEEVPDWSFEAAHPISIDPTTMANVLRGVQIEERQSMPPLTSSMELKAVRVFSDDDIEFLTPLLATALSKADPEDLVVFRIAQSASAGTVRTAGTLYAHEYHLYLTLTQYRSNSDSKSGRQLSGSGGLTRRVVSFVPASAQLHDTHMPPGAPAQSNLRTLIINYASLAELPSQKPELAKIPTTTPAIIPAPVSHVSALNDRTSVDAAAKDVQDAEFLGRKLEELRVSRERVSKKDVELKAMKRDMQSVRRQLAADEAVGRMPIYHAVKSGETVFRLARNYRVRQEQVRKWNNLQDDKIEVGQKLIVGYGAEIQKLKGKKKPVQPAKKTASVNGRQS